MSSKTGQGFNRIRFEFLLILISLVIANTLINLFVLIYIYSFKFIRHFSDVFEVKYQLPFLLFENIILVLMQLFTIHSAARIYSKSDPTVIRTDLLRLIVIWSVLILFEFIVAMQFYLSSGEISTLLLDDFYKGYHDYNESEYVTEVVNKVSEQFACCGIENSTDWETNRPYGSETASIPKSCCKRAYNKCDTTNSTQINNQGCAKIIIEWANEHIYLYLLLWFLLVVFSLCFCYLLKRIAYDIEENETIGDIKSMFLQNSENENLMNSRSRLKNYQDLFSRCTIGKQAIQIGYPTLVNDQDQLNSTTSMNSLNDNLGKLTRYSQIRYSKVKPSIKLDGGDEKIELTCHQEEVNQDSSYDEDSAADYSTSTNRTSRKKSKITNDAELNKSLSIKSIDRLNNSSVVTNCQKSTKCIKETKDRKNSFKSNPNYDPNYTQYKYNSNYDLIEKSESCSPSSDDSYENSNLIHPKDKHTFDKIKNKLTEIYLSNDSFISDKFDDVSIDCSSDSHNSEKSFSRTTGRKGK